MSHNKDNCQLDRREFIVGSASIAIAASAGMVGCDEAGRTKKDTGAGIDLGQDAATDAASDAAASCSEMPQPLEPVSGPSRVVEAIDPQAVTATSYDDARVQAMLLAGLTALADTDDIKQAWKILLPDFASSMRIGLKVNCLNSKLYNSTSLLKAMIATLTQDLGADPQRVWIWDRRTDELERSKMDEATLGVKVAGTILSTKDSSGPGYESEASCVIDQQTHLSRILTQETDITINLPVLKTHNIPALTGALKNTYGCIDNPGEFHAGFNQYMPAIYRLDPIHKRLRLHIIEALRAVTKGDTTDYPDALPGRLLLSTDPLALDTHAVQLVNTLRAADSLNELPTDKLGWLGEAAALNLGSQSVDAQLITMP
jgi:hypothetical protein